MPYRRRSIRLKGYDYSQTGIYFITICVNGRKHLFGRINNKKMILNLYGRIVHSKWIDIPRHFENARLDVFQIMPDIYMGLLY
jgi:REP element-mobilizing transposase RayT